MCTSDVQVVQPWRFDSSETLACGVAQLWAVSPKIVIMIAPGYWNRIPLRSLAVRSLRYEALKALGVLCLCNCRRSPRTAELRMLCEITSHSYERISARQPSGNALLGCTQSERPAAECPKSCVPDAQSGKRAELNVTDRQTQILHAVSSCIMRSSDNR